MNNNLIDNFLYIMKNGYGKDDKTIKSYRICLNEMQQYVFDGEEVTIDMLNNIYADDYLVKWLKVRQNEGLKASSLNQRISCLRSLYKWLIGRGELRGHDVSKSIPMFRNTTHETKEVLTKEECWKLLDIAVSEVEKNENYNTLRDLLICQLFLGCGLRISEVSNLDIDCFNLDENKLYLTKTKFDKFRKVSIPSEVIATFTKYMAYRIDKNNRLSEDLQNALFISRKHNRLSPEQIRLDLYRILGLCKFNKHITPHSLRHSFGTLLLQSGSVTLEDVANEMGHSNVNTLVNWYYHKDSKDISKSNPVFNREVKNKPKTKKVNNVIQIRFA